MKKIPKSQAAYQAGRSTTEHVMAFKLLAEKAITSADFELYILMKDMSRAFDTVNRKLLMEDLREILEDDELHVCKLLLEDVSLMVRCGQSCGETFNTNIGTPQGDCLSPLLFILYLANALKPEIPVTSSDHTYCIKEDTPMFHDDHTYSKMNRQNPTKDADNNLDESIDAQYADDINYLTQNYSVVQHHKRSIPPKLKKRDLISNDSKDEEYHVTRKKYDPSTCVNCAECKRCMKCQKCKSCPYCKNWKQCKCLGSMIDTDTDIRRRKARALEALRKLDHVWKNERTSIKTKVMFFNALVGSIFLYNASLWSMNETRNGQVNSFQRRMLRYAINIKWPRKISNDNLYNITKQVKWSDIISYRRLTWFGHLIRLPESTPARRALRIAESDVTRPRGRQKTTWLGCVKDQLKTMNKNYNEAKTMALDRVGWRGITQQIRPQWAEVPGMGR